MSRLLLVIAAVAVATPIASGQNNSGPGAWYAYGATVAQNRSPFSMSVSAEGRFYDLGSDLEQINFGGVASVSVPDRSASAGLGYGFFFNDAPDSGGDTVTEHRIVPHVTLSHRLMTAAASHRFRLENRFTSGSDFRTRYRYRVSLTVPLGERQIRQGTFYFTASNEIFLNGVGRDGGPIFNQDRVAGQLGYRISQSTDIRAGYMTQIYENDTDGQFVVGLLQRFSQ